MKHSKIGILILAAGGSVRMGRPKQLLQLGGKSLVRRAAETAVEAGVEPIVIVTGAGADQVAAEVRDLPVHLVMNPSWGNGMGSSVRSGVRSLLSLEPGLDALIIMLCDQPEISTTTLRKLINAHNETGKLLCAASFGETVGPPAFFGRRYFDELLSISEKFGAKQILLNHRADLLRVDCPEAARDVDTPADYEALKSDARLADKDNSLD